VLFAEYLGDYPAAISLASAFRYTAITPMRALLFG